MLIIYNIITRNYCLNKTTLIFAVAFLLSDSICCQDDRGRFPVYGTLSPNVGQSHKENPLKNLEFLHDFSEINDEIY